MAVCSSKWGLLAGVFDTLAFLLILKTQKCTIENQTTEENTLNDGSEWGGTVVTFWTHIQENASSNRPSAILI